MKFMHLAELQQLSEANKPLLAKVKELGKAGGLEDSDLEGMIDAKQIGKNIYVISKDTYEPGQFIMNIFHVSKNGKSGDWGGTPMDEYKSKKDALAALAALKESVDLTEAKSKKFFTLTIPAGCKATEDEIFGDDEGDKSFIQNQSVVTVEYIKKNGDTVKVYPLMDAEPDMSDEAEKRLQKAFDKWCANLKEDLITEVQVRLKPKTRVKALDHFGSETENPGGHRDIKNTMKFLDIENLAKDKLHSIDSDGDAADFKKHARNLGFKELEYPDNNDAKLAGFERVGVKNGTTFWKKGNALLLLAKDTPPTFMIKEGQEQLTEAAGNLSRSVENWMDANKAYSFEGPRGVRNLTKLAGALGYSSLDDFLEDNSGAIEAVVEWIGSQNVPEWKEKLKA